jgi:hypothetical protein
MALPIHSIMFATLYSSLRCITNVPELLFQEREGENRR